MKSVILISMIGIALSHLTFIILRIIPTNPLSNHYRDFVIDYTAVFPQEWLLFAPNPPTVHYSVEYRCKGHGADWTSWEDLTDRYIQGHNRYRISSHLYSNRQIIASMRDLQSKRRELEEARNCDVDDKECVQSLKESLKSLPEFQRPSRIIARACDEFRAIHAEQVHFRMKQTFVPNFSERHSGAPAKQLINSYPFAEVGDAQ